jgi:Protein of unknown function (DUF2853)
VSKRDELISKYAADLKEKCGIAAEMSLLTKITESLGPTIYRDDASTVSASDKEEMDRVRTNFLTKKLGLTDADGLDAGMNSVVEQYGRSNRNKYRAVFYYLLVKHFKREGSFA